MKKAMYYLIFAAIAWTTGCATAPERDEGKAVLNAEVKQAIVEFKAKDPDIERFFRDSEGYAVLPKVGKGAFIIGGAWGQGEVYKKGELVGYTSLSQATIGASLGGESFREIIFFRTNADMEVFMTGEFTFSAQATAVALDAGAAAKADYRDGMAIFIIADKGLMIDASIGGQKFKFLPK